MLVLLSVLQATAFAQDPTSSGVWTIDLSASHPNATDWSMLQAKGLTNLRIMVLPEGLPPLTIDPSSGVLPVSVQGGRIEFVVAAANVTGTFSNSTLNGTLTLEDAQYAWSASLSSSLWVCGGLDHAPHHVVPTELVEPYTKEKGCTSWRKLRGPEDVPPPAPAPPPAVPAVEN